MRPAPVSCLTRSVSVGRGTVTGMAGGLPRADAPLRPGARVIATCRSESDREIASRAGADEVFLIDNALIGRIRGSAPGGVDHIVEVAFGANIKSDIGVLAQGGSIAVYATNVALPEVPVWQLVMRPWPKRPSLQVGEHEVGHVGGRGAQRPGGRVLDVLERC